MGKPDTPILVAFSPDNVDQFGDQLIFRQGPLINSEEVNLGALEEKLDDTDGDAGKEKTSETLEKLKEKADLLKENDGLEKLERQIIEKGEKEGKKLAQHKSLQALRWIRHFKGVKGIKIFLCCI